MLLTFNKEIHIDIKKSFCFKPVILALHLITILKYWYNDKMQVRNTYIIFFKVWNTSTNSMHPILHKDYVFPLIYSGQTFLIHSMHMFIFTVANALNIAAISQKCLLLLILCFYVIHVQVLYICLLYDNDLVEKHQCFYLCCHRWASSLNF